MKKIELVDRGESAKIALAEFNRVFEELEKECYETFQKSSPDDDEGRFRIWAYDRVLRDIRGKFNVSIRNGEQARKDLAKIKRKVA